MIYWCYVILYSNNLATRARIELASSDRQSDIIAFIPTSHLVSLEGLEPSTQWLKATYSTY